MDDMPDNVQPADLYRPCDDLWLVTAYFNSTHSRNRQANYHAFAERIRRSHLHLLTVECAFGDDDYELPASADTVQVRSQHVLWQKERLLNLAIQRVPEHIRKIAWLDCDVLFANPDWACDTSRLLDTWPVVHLFERIVQLAPGATVARVEDAAWDGFGSVIARDPTRVGLGSDRHGRTGFGWAYRRELLDKHGLYDGGIVGDGDHMLAHAMLGDFDSACAQNPFRIWPVEASRPARPSLPRRLARRWLPQSIRTALGRRPPPPQVNPPHLNHFRAWGERFYADAQGRVSFTPGTIFHLWHGSHTNRRYGERRRALIENAYSPAEDVRLNAMGCWEWNSDKPALHAAVEHYFHLRNEDEQ